MARMEIIPKRHAPPVPEKRRIVLADDARKRRRMRLKAIVARSLRAAMTEEGVAGRRGP